MTPSLQKKQKIYDELKTKRIRIENYSDEELDAVITILGIHHPEYYQILNFVDSYFEKRRRRLLQEASK